MRRQLGFPFGLQSLAHERLSCPIRLGGNAQRPFVGRAAFGYPGASERGGLALKTESLGKCQALWWGERLDPINARCPFPAVILGYATHREQPCIPRLQQQFLELASCPDISTLRGSVHSLLEAEDVPVDGLPGQVLPGHHQGLALCFGALPLTHHCTFQDTGPLSAYPGRYPRPWLLRPSLSPAASGWYLLRRATSSREDHWGLRRSLSPWLEPVGRHSPPGFVTVPPGQSFGC
jgi:hypothetical protein